MKPASKLSGWISSRPAGFEAARPALKLSDAFKTGLAINPSPTYIYLYMYVQVKVI